MNISSEQVSLSDVLSKMKNNKALKETEEILQECGQTAFTDDGRYKGITEVLSMLTEIWDNEDLED